MITREYLLWNNCPNNCSFCHLKNEYQSTKEDKLKSIQLTMEDISKQTEPFNCLLVGGEIFVGLENEVKQELEKLYELIFSNQLINIIYINTNIIYNINDFLLNILFMARDYNRIKYIHFTVSDDVVGRFNDSKKLLFVNNLQTLRNRFPLLDIIVNTILTDEFCDYVINKKYNIKQYCDKYKVKVNVLPYVDLNGIDSFIPTLDKLVKTLTILKSQYPDWFKGYQEIFTKKSSLMFLQQYNKDNTLHNVNADSLKCGHSENFSTCCKERKCYSCILSTL